MDNDPMFIDKLLFKNKEASKEFLAYRQIILARIALSFKLSALVSLYINTKEEQFLSEATELFKSITGVQPDPAKLLDLDFILRITIYNTQQNLSKLSEIIVESAQLDNIKIHNVDDKIVKLLTEDVEGITEDEKNEWLNSLLNFGSQIPMIKA